MSGRIKSKVVNATLANSDVLDMFQGVLGGTGTSSLPITHQKYLRVRTHVERYLRLLSVLQESALLTGLFPDMRAHLVAYVTALRGQFAVSFSVGDFAEHLPVLTGVAAAAGPTASDYARVPAAVVAEFETVFKAMKSCSLVNGILVTCRNLIVHKKSIGDVAALKDKFLARDAGMSFTPLPDLSQLNFKRIYNDSALGPSERKFILVILNKMLSISHEVYEAISAPDVDVDEFVGIIMSSVEEVKKHIPRCDQAFAKIVESVDLLKGNFSSYFKDYAASGNSSIMMENFVLDVSKNTNATPQVTAQFRRIISHYRKLAAQQSSNPKLQTLFAQVDANFQELERTTGPSTDEIAAEIAAADSAAEAAAEAADAAAAAAASAAPGKNASRNKQRRMRAKQKAGAAAGSAASSAAGDSASAAGDSAAAAGAVAAGDSAAAGAAAAAGDSDSDDSATDDTVAVTAAVAVADLDDEAR
jgi:hypothetical protein